MSATDLFYPAHALLLHVQKVSELSTLLLVIRVKIGAAGFGVLYSIVSNGLASKLSLIIMNLLGN